MYFVPPSSSKDSSLVIWQIWFHLHHLNFQALFSSFNYLNCSEIIIPHFVNLHSQTLFNNFQASKSRTRKDSLHYETAQTYLSILKMKDYNFYHKIKCRDLLG
jgi:hypothetical protein